jgi:hypothetical protein
VTSGPVTDPADDTAAADGTATSDDTPPSEDADAAVDTGLRWWRELIYVAAFYLVYSWIRNQFGSNSVHPDEAFEHALQIIDAEKALGLYVEPTIQSWFVSVGSGGLDFTFAGARAVMRFWNIFYGTFHFIVTGGALIWIYRRFPTSYRKWRNTLAITTGLALVGFSLYPLMPPRLLSACNEYGRCLAEHSYVDSLAAIGGLWSFDSGTMQAVSNQYAAMPSLHFGWSLWCCLALFPHLRHTWSRVLIVLYPMATLFAIMVTANHYWLDAAGGALTLGVGYLAGSASARAIETRRLARIATRATPDPVDPAR